MQIIKVLNHSWLNEGKESSKKKRELESSNNQRKRVNTMSSNHSKDNKLGNKMGKKLLAETCKDNLRLEIKMAMKSPSNKKEVNSYRKVEK